MEIVRSIIDLIDINLIFGLIPAILTLIIVEFLFKERFDTKRTLSLIRWNIIIYTTIILIYYLIEIIINKTDNSLFNQLSGPYAFIRWIMLSSSLVIPFSLFVKKLGTSFIYVLFVAFCIKIGSYFEHFIIITTSLERDYLQNNRNHSIVQGIVMIILQGVVIAILTLGSIELSKKKNQ